MFGFINGAAPHGPNWVAIQILDADYAAETSVLASKRMANEAALAMVSQANQQASVVQHLLKVELSKRIQ